MQAKARLRKEDWDVGGVSREVAEDLIASYHYARGVSSVATAVHGLYPLGWRWYFDCVGVAWWLPPTQWAARALAGEDDWQGVLSLSRLAIAPDAPANAASFMLSRSMQMLDRDRWPLLVTYADTWQGHTGRIYLATGWDYAGMTEPEGVYTLNGQMIARKAGKRSRTHTEMLELGAVHHGNFAKHRFIHRRPKNWKLYKPTFVVRGRAA
ncbi:hypothetical protein ACVIGB_000610 [Bradyrhizobium sp. USDA 4341]